MGKIKIEKKDIWIDMTPMSDVMTLLLCFFMLTSTFLTPEPVKVNTPSSVSEVKVPENDVLNILVSPEGNIYVGSENKNTMVAMMETVTDKFGVQLNGTQLKHFKEDAMIGAPMALFARSPSIASKAERVSSRSGLRLLVKPIPTFVWPSRPTPRLLMQSLRR